MTPVQATPQQLPQAPGAHSETTQEVEGSKLIQQAADQVVNPLTEEEQKAQIEALLKSLQEEMKAQEGNDEPIIPIPDELKHLFKAPLNQEILGRDYNVWMRAMRIASYIYAQSALQFQGISAATSAIALVTGLCITQYSQLLMAYGTMAYASYATLTNLASLFIGSDSWSERKAQWRAASEDPSYFSAFAKRISLFTGTTSVSQRIANVFKGGLSAYMVRVAYDVLHEITGNWWTQYPVKAINLTREWGLPLASTLAAGGISYFGMMVAWTLNGEGIRKLGDEFKGFNEDMTFSGELERLYYISQEEYLEDLAKAMDLESYDQLQKQRQDYALDILYQVKLRKYAQHSQIELTPLQDLATLNAEDPEGVLKPVVAQLIVLQKQKEQVLETYQNLIETNNLTQAQKVFSQTLKPLLFKIEFLKQTILDPARPAMGNLAPDGTSYFSLMSLLIGSELKWDLNSTDPLAVQREAADVFINEAAIQKIVYHAKGKEEVMLHHPEAQQV